MSTLIPQGNPYELFVHLGHQLGRLEDRSSQSKIWQLFHSITQGDGIPEEHSSGGSFHAFDLTDSRITSTAETLNTIVTHLLHAQELPPHHLLESITFNANCLAIVRNLQEQLKAIELMPDAAIGELETNLTALSEKWLHILIEEPGQFYTVVCNPVTSALSLSFLQQKWQGLSEFLESWMSPVALTPWPPSESAEQCYSMFLAAREAALSKSQVMSERLDRLQDLFEWSAEEGKISPEQLLQIRERLPQCKAILSDPMRMTKEGFEFLTSTFLDLNAGVDLLVRQIAADVRESLTFLSQKAQEGKNIDQVRLQQINAFFASVPPIPQEGWIASSAATDFREWRAYAQALKELRAQYVLQEQAAEDEQRAAPLRQAHGVVLSRLRQLAAAIPPEMGQEYKELCALGQTVEPQLPTDRQLYDSFLANFQQQIRELEQRVSTFEVKLIQNFSDDLGVAPDVGAIIFRGAQNNWDGFFLEMPDGNLKQTHDIPHLKIYKLPGTNRIVADYGLDVIGGGSYKRIKEVHRVGGPAVVRLTSRFKKREAELQRLLGVEWDPEKRAPMIQELERLQKRFLIDITTEEEARTALEGIPNIAEMTKVHYWSKTKPGKESRLKTRYIMTKYEGDLRSLTLGPDTSKSRIQILKCFGDVLRCISEMHKRKLIHVDLRDANVLFSGDRGFVSDFGFLSKQGAKLDFIGALIYMAPETVFHREDQGITTEMDLFSLGIMLLEFVDNPTYLTWQRTIAQLEEKSALDSSFLSKYEEALYSGRCSLSDREVMDQKNRLAAQKSEITSQYAKLTIELESLAKLEENIANGLHCLSRDDVDRQLARSSKRKKEILDMQYDLKNKVEYISQFEKALDRGAYSLSPDDVSRQKLLLLEKKAALHEQFEKDYYKVHGELQAYLRSVPNPLNPLISRLISVNPGDRTTCSDAESEFARIFSSP